VPPPPKNTKETLGVVTKEVKNFDIEELQEPQNIDISAQ